MSVTNHRRLRHTRGQGVSGKKFFSTAPHKSPSVARAAKQLPAFDVSRWGNVALYGCLCVCALLVFTYNRVCHFVMSLLFYAFMSGQVDCFTMNCGTHLTCLTQLDRNLCRKAPKFHRQLKVAAAFQAKTVFFACFYTCGVSCCRAFVYTDPTCNQRVYKERKKSAALSIEPHYLGPQKTG